MSGMKQLSAGSSQILMMMFRDKNNAPIKADSVHVKGSIFTGSSSSLTEVPNSRYSTTIEANRKIAKNIQSKSISFPIQQGESVRFLANSNIDDGFYLQSGTDGKPLFEVIINFKEMVGMPFIPDELEKGATEFYE